jgi:hypothetical protein
LKRKRVYLFILFLILSSLACNAAIPPKNSTAPNTVQTARPTNGPKAGHWEGDPSVSFDVLADGTVQNFKITASAGVMDTCKLDGAQAKVDGKSLVLSEWMDYTDSMRAFIVNGVGQGAKQPGTKKGANGELLESKHIEGIFDTPETVSGTYLITICEDSIYTIVKLPTWSAKWVKP